MDCAHHLDGAGICERPHGHTYRIEAVWEGSDPARRARGHAALQSALDELDHRDLNDWMPVATCENLTLRLAKRLDQDLPGLSRLRVYEGLRAWAEVGPEDWRALQA